MANNKTLNINFLLKKANKSNMLTPQQIIKYMLKYLTIIIVKNIILPDKTKGMAL